MSSSPAHAAVLPDGAASGDDEPDIALLKRFDVPGPRYTSYPTADRFVEAFGHADALGAYAVRRSVAAQAARPLSMYIHIPFCESLCYYCACNKIITRHHEKAAPYLDDLERELALVVAQLAPESAPESAAEPPPNAPPAAAGLPKVSQLHLGGGSPTFLSDAELARLMQMLRARVQFTQAVELSIEVDPRTVDAQRLAHLRALGFNRLSFGVQDFDAAVQKAVHRQQSTEAVFALMQAARALGFESINVDLIYGLPLQSQATFAQTLQTLADLRPDRVALYAYAHLPERFKPQRRIDSFKLPSAGEKVAMQAQALRALRQAGYVEIGMDHFALPQDSLSIARQNGLLHRNFQGYSTQADTDLIGLGVSAISKIGAAYSQNVKDVQSYHYALAQGHLPVARGLALGRDDLMRQSIIMALMCQGVLSMDAVEQAWLVDFPGTFASELQTLAQYQEDGLVRLGQRQIEVTPKGWHFVRAIAMVFDRYLQADQRRAKFSRIL
ncbi:oxygen-independent coproporphyrinogen III oxidase [Allofranklinella schreckenbergeri]|uniref:Coproporphyrinogen-III oxidase n=1 Tax=Allofranklinella schreckenbergeri TaxID=1076744 RepID=A0A3M6R1R9_9BURK|nr:oxygen-independent coproporphyrinogen III oxidase [Allofranklinella schreckenbergeri]RMX09166.1 oxygen-independent coproporphyrinogen III oxidase [Allofranklinella schreckenbergeri]